MRSKGDINQLLHSSVVDPSSRHRMPNGHTTERPLGLSLMTRTYKWGQALAGFGGAPFHCSASVLLSVRFARLDCQRNVTLSCSNLATLYWFFRIVHSPTRNQIFSEQLFPKSWTEAFKVLQN